MGKRMIPLSRKVVLALTLPAVAFLAAQPGPKKAAVKKPPATQPAGKSALDKAALEPWVRHLYVWGPAIQVRISDPVPSTALPGFFDVKLHASAGGASHDETLLVSKDGQKILKALVFDIRQNPFKPDLDKLKTQFQPSLGTPGAPVVLVHFSDYQCPMCKEEAKVLRDNLLKTYPTQVRLYFKDFPLEQIHPWAKMGAIAGRCVFRQNPAAFWDFQDWIFEHQAEITPENLKTKVMEYARTKELDQLLLGRCLDTRATEAEVDRNVADARALGLNSTPTLFVNGRRLVGQITWPNLQQIINYELEYQKTAKNAGEEACCELPALSPAPKAGP